MTRGGKLGGTTLDFQLPLSANQTIVDILLSVIIVSYENEDVVINCLNSIKKYNDIGDALEVIVVEQSKTDVIFNQLRVLFPEFTIIRNCNKGFGAGNNRGVEIAKGTFLLFLNSDTILIEPVFKFAIETFMAMPDLGLFGVRLLDGSGKRAQSFYFRNTISLINGMFWRVLDRIDLYLPTLMYITGADMFVRSIAFNQVGGFDERMFMYFEEIDLCNRLNSLGYKTRYLKERRIVHLEGGSTNQSGSFRIKLDSLLILAKKNGQNYRALLAKWRRIMRIKRLFRPKDETIGEQLRIIDDYCSQFSDIISNQQGKSRLGDN